MEQAIRELASGETNPLEATIRLDLEIGGITGVKWNPGTGQYTIYNHTARVQLPVRGANKREYKKLQELAVLAYLQAQRNGNWKAGEVHLSHEFSSKDHHFKEQALAIRARYSTN